MGKARGAIARNPGAFGLSTLKRESEPPHTEGRPKRTRLAVPTRRTGPKWPLIAVPEPERFVGTRPTPGQQPGHPAGVSPPRRSRGNPLGADALTTSRSLIRPLAEGTRSRPRDQALAAGSLCHEHHVLHCARGQVRTRLRRRTRRRERANQARARRRGGGAGGGRAGSNGGHGTQSG